MGDTIVSEDSKPTDIGETQCLRVDGLNNRHDEHLSRQYFTKIGIKGMTKVQKAPRWQHAYITFETAEQAKAAKLQMDGSKYQEVHLLSCSFAKVWTESRKRKRKQTEATVEDNRSEVEKLNDKVTSLWRLPYEEQLSKKQLAMNAIMDAYRSALTKQSSLGDGKEADLPKFSQRLLPIIGSPEEARKGYRNKCEFSLGTGTDGLPTVGFMLGLFKEGAHAVASCTDCVHIDDNSKAVAGILERYLRATTSSSGRFAVFDRVTHEGHWRLAMVRSQRSGEVMILIQVHPQDLKQDVMTAMQQSLIQYLCQECTDNISTINQLTILWQWSDAVHNGISDKHPIDVLYGPGFIHEQLRSVVDGQVLEDNDGFKFRISAHSFFQSSTLACELLYGQIGDWIVEEPNTQITLPSPPLVPDNSDLSVQQRPRRKILLDLCCGTGTIGMVLSQRPEIKYIFGVEMCPSAVEDAKHNAKLNGIELDKEELSGPLLVRADDGNNNPPRFRYICAKVEDALSGLLKYLEQSEIDLSQYEVVALLDPPRTGTHKSVSKAIRECLMINRVIYVSCSPKAAMQNWVELTRPEDAVKRFRGRPFELKRAIPVDMFPQTELCELLLEFTR